MERIAKSNVSVQPVSIYVLLKAEFKLSSIAIRQEKVSSEDLKVMEVVGTGEAVRTLNIGDKVLISNSEIKNLIQYKVDVEENEDSLSKVKIRMNDLKPSEMKSTSVAMEMYNVVEYFILHDHLICAIVK